MRFKHTKRPGFLLGFIDFFTAGLFFLLYMPLGGLQKELEEILGHKVRPYWQAYLLGIPTLFIYTLVWMARISEELKTKAVELGVEGPHTSWRHMFWWNMLGCFCFGPMIATHRFFGTLNKTESLLNANRTERKQKIMKTVVITGSARGFGLCQARKFKELGCNVVLSDVNEVNLMNAAKELENVGPADTKVIHTVCDVTDCSALQALWDLAKSTFGSVDIWVNNAGVNSPDKPAYELTEKEIRFLLDIDLKGTIYGSKIAFAGMKEQGFGQIYNVEGYGSNDAMMTGLTLYGTAKRAVTYFTLSLSKESKELTDGKVCVCRLTPGIMITDFIKTANGGATKIELPEKTKKIYNILGDYPETIVEYCVPKMLANQKNNTRIMWLTNRRAFGRFLTAGFKKRDFFS